ncbi:MAG: hypothetical protein IPI67_11080 [Myxococcales bacterium]|nr:hypothetical protein [Myxococcales bacterium]
MKRRTAAVLCAGSLATCCPPGMLDACQCAVDAGCHPSIADAGTIPCGTQTCSGNQLCVFHCCVGAPTDAAACKPASPSCVDVSAVSCTPCDGSGACSAPAETCSGTLDGQNLNCVCA